MRGWVAESLCADDKDAYDHQRLNREFGSVRAAQLLNLYPNEWKELHSWFFEDMQGDSSYGTDEETNVVRLCLKLIFLFPSSNDSFDGSWENTTANDVNYIQCWLHIPDLTSLKYVNIICDTMALDAGTSMGLKYTQSLYLWANDIGGMNIQAPQCPLASLQFANTIKCLRTLHLLRLEEILWLLDGNEISVHQ